MLPKKYEIHHFLEALSDYLSRRYSLVQPQDTKINSAHLHNMEMNSLHFENYCMKFCCLAIKYSAIFGLKNLLINLIINMEN